MSLRLSLRSTAYAGPLRRRLLSALTEELDDIGLVVCSCCARPDRRTPANTSPRSLGERSVGMRPGAVMHVPIEVAAAARAEAAATAGRRLRRDRRRLDDRARQGDRAGARAAASWPCPPPTPARR